MPNKEGSDGSCGVASHNDVEGVRRGSENCEIDSDGVHFDDRSQEVSSLSASLSELVSSLSDISVSSSSSSSLSFMSSTSQAAVLISSSGFCVECVPFQAPSTSSTILSSS